MIRRNHIDNGCKVNRDVIRSRPRPVLEVPHPQKYCQRVSPEVNENMRITSNNKKYHQYKEQRESKTKQVQEFKEETKESVTLAEVRQNNDDRRENQLRREYTYDQEETLKIDYNSISLKTQQEPKRVAKIAHLKQQEEAKHKQALSNNSYNPSVDRIAPLSPKNRSNFQSSHKDPRYMTSRGFVPLFEETSLSLKRKQLQQSRTRRQSELGKIYQPSSKKIMKTDYQNFKEKEASFRERRQSNSEYNTINKYINNYPSSQAYPPKKGILPAETLTIKEAVSLKAPSLPASYHKEEVSQKLRMISDFNDQINERIKNIIGCFQGLKNKL